MHPNRRLMNVLHIRPKYTDWNLSQKTGSRAGPAPSWGNPLSQSPSAFRRTTNVAPGNGMREAPSKCIGGSIRTRLMVIFKLDLLFFELDLGLIFNSTYRL